MIVKHKAIFEAYIVNKDNAEIILTKLNRNYGKLGEDPNLKYKAYVNSPFNVFPLTCRFGYWDDKKNALRFGEYLYQCEHDIDNFNKKEHELFLIAYERIVKEGQYFVIGDYENEGCGYDFYAPYEFNERYELAFETFNNNK